MAGPCAIESREQAFAIAERVARAGAQFFRGGAYKPRTSPYSFQGLGEEGLKIMAEIRDRFGLLIVTEAVDNESLDLVDQYADVIQIGARNMQNFSLLKRAGRARKPVLLKRGMSATLEEFLMAAEYIMSEGNYNVVLCERGVRTFADHTRNTLDLSVVPAVQRLSHLPIIVDPSHGTGKRNKVTPLSRAAVAVGADGLIVEVHHDPDRALSDGMQSLFPDQFDALMAQVRQIAAVLGRSIPEPSVVSTHVSSWHIDDSRPPNPERTNMTLRVLFLPLLLVGTAIAQDSAPIWTCRETITSPICRGQDSDVPGCITPPHATYLRIQSTRRRRAKRIVEGPVIVDLVVDADGLPRDIKVSRPLSP